jgi:hypothetical protein
MCIKFKAIRAEDGSIKKGGGAGRPSKTARESLNIYKPFLNLYSFG